MDAEHGTLTTDTFWRNGLAREPLGVGPLPTGRIRIDSDHVYSIKASTELPIFSMDFDQELDPADVSQNFPRSSQRVTARSNTLVRG
jgi:hypothetical protein